MKQTFAKLARQNTGSHMCDSGGENGRQWQRPLAKKDQWLGFYERIDRETGECTYEISATINTVAFLDAHLEIDQDLTKLFKKMDYDVEAFAKLMNRKEQDRQNTYNGESDLNQVFQYTVLSNKIEWYYDENALVLLETHNGADVRGGYSDYVVCRAVNELTNLFDVTCGVSFIKGVDNQGQELDRDELQALDERFQVGYCSCPTYELDKFIKRVINPDQQDDDLDQLTVELKSGHIVTMVPSPRM